MRSNMKGRSLERVFYFGKTSEISDRHSNYTFTYYCLRFIRHNKYHLHGQKLKGKGKYGGIINEFSVEFSVENKETCERSARQEPSTQRSAMRTQMKRKQIRKVANITGELWSRYLTVSAGSAQVPVCNSAVLHFS